MTVKLIDFIDSLIAINEEIRLFDEDDYLLFKGKKTDLLRLFSTNPILATREIFAFYFIGNIIYITLE